MLAPLSLLALIAAPSLAPLAPELLTPRALAHLQATVEREKLTTRSSLLQATEQQLLAGDQPVRREQLSVPGYVRLEPPVNPARTQAALEQALATLRRADLVSERTAARLEKQLPSLALPFQLVGLAASYEAYDEWWNPTSIAAFVLVLRKHDLVDADGAARIDAALAAGRLGSPFELLAFCEHARGFDLTKYPPDPAVYLPQLHREVAALHPALGFQTFSYQIGRDEKTSFPGFELQRLTVTLRTARKSYRHGSTFAAAKPGVVGPKFPLDVQGFYGVFNRMLADAGSPARLHLVRFRMRDTAVNAYDDERFGLILLTEKQAEALRSVHPHGGAAYFDASYEDVSGGRRGRR